MRVSQRLVRQEFSEAQSLKNDTVRLAATGTAWMGRGVRSVNSLIEEMLDAADSEVTVVAYLIGKGAMGFLDKLEDCLRRGIRVGMVINKYIEQPATIRYRIGSFVEKYPHFSA